MILIENGGWAVHDGEGRIAARGDQADTIERRLLGVVQVVGTLMKRNRVYREP